MNPNGMYQKIILAGLISGLFLFFEAEAVKASSQHLKGKVNVEGGKALKDIIVFLEPVGGAIPPHSPQKYKVSQKGRKFLPSFLVIIQGDTVQYLNDEDREIDHNIYSLSKIQTFDLGLGDKGSVLEHGFGSPGRLNYFCSVHKTMEGKLVVLPTRYFTVLKKPGNFILPGIPPGKWKLKAVVFHRRYKAEPIDISVGAESVKDLVLKIVKR